MANFDSNWDALAGAGGGGLTWATLSLADVADTYDGVGARPPLDLISANETDGLWSIDINNVVNTNVHIDWVIAPPSGAWALFIRFTEITHPAVGTGIRVTLTAGAFESTRSDPGAGYAYGANTANMLGGVWISEVDFNNAVEVTRASVTKIEAVAHGNDLGAAGFGVVSHAGTANNWGIQTASGDSLFSRLTLSIDTPNAVGVQTIGFKVEYAIVTLGDLP